MKKILLSTLVLATTTLAVSFEYPTIYKDPRAMGMGGAYVAVGGTSSAVFYNPAGLAKINKESGWEVNLLKITAGAGNNSIDFINDTLDALNAEDGDYITPSDGDDGDDQLYALNKVIKQYQGENLHFTFNNYSSISKRWKKLAFTIGLFSGVNSNTVTHQGFGLEGIIEKHLDMLVGPVVGFSYDFTKYNLSIGLSAKYMYRKLIDHYFTTRELVENEDNLDNYILNEVAKDGTAFGADIGVIYNTDKIHWLPISIGASLLNIGDMDFGEAGKIPMTLNLGIALKPKIPIFDWTFAIDYVDVTNNYEEDDNKLKRLRAGVEVVFFDKWWGAAKIRGGVYQSYFTAGAELRLFLLTAMFTTYEEEVGAYAGQKGDRRYLLTVALGW